MEPWQNRGLPFVIAFFKDKSTHFKKKKSFCSCLTEIRSGKEDFHQSRISLLDPPLPHHFAKKAFSLSRAIIGFKESEGSTNYLLPIDFLFHFWSLHSKLGVGHGGKDFLNPKARGPLKGKLDADGGKPCKFWH